MRAVNLLPPDTRGALTVPGDLASGPAVRGGAGPFVLLGVLAACVAGVAGYVLTDNTVKQRTADLATATAQQQAIAREAAQLKPYADFDATARSRVATVKDIAGSRFDWEQVLRHLRRAIPADVTLKALTGDTATGAGGAGGASSQLRSAINAPAITLQGCAPGQTEVSRLLARLHDVQGVTRVTLSKSTKSKVDAGGDTSGSSAQRRNTMPCGTGKRPDFEVVMFFEKAAETVAKAPSATGGATATPVPVATATPTPTPSTTAADAAPEGGATP